MTKSARAKREKKKDFVKKKIKVGKTLKKPQNETITTFKSRSIQIIEQLAAKEAGNNVTKKRYNMTELCSRLGHNNPNHKLDACSGVKELLAKQTSDQIRESLSMLVASLSRCLQDDDLKVRNTTISLIESLIDKVGCSSMASHFTLLGRHLSCGLVSLHSDVQASSLKLLHLLLKRAPQLLELHATTIVPNLLRLLGTKTKTGSALQKVFTQSLGGVKLTKPQILKDGKNHNKKTKMGDKKPPASAEDDLIVLSQHNNKQTCLVWQLDVFVLLTAILGHVVDGATSSAVIDSNTPRSRWQALLQSVSGSERSLTENDGVSHNSSFALLSQPNKLQAFCTAMLPLLHSLWKNMLPERGGVAMNNNSAHCLWCLVQLQSVLVRTVETCTGSPATQCPWFVELVKGIFGNLLNNHFPFHYVDLPALEKKKADKKKKNRYDERPSGSSDDLNLRLSTVGVQFRLFHESQHYTLVKYAHELLSSEEKVGSYDMQAACQLIMSLVDLFLPESRYQQQWMGNSATVKADAALANKQRTVNELLTAALGCYKKQHPLKKERKMLLVMLLQLTDADHRHIHSLGVVREWCLFLVTELRENPVLPATLLTTVLQLALRRCPGLCSLDQSVLQQIENNLVSGCKDLSVDEKTKLLRLLQK